MVTTAYELRERLQDLLAEVDLSAQVDLIAMHLTEIEEETTRFLDQLTAFRSYARHKDAVAAQEALVEVSLALQHMANHIVAVTPILDQELDIGDGD